MTSTRLAGHSLRNEGRPFEDDNGQPRMKERSSLAPRWGFGLCECGARSHYTKGDTARKRWHAWHKQAIRAEAKS